MRLTIKPGVSLVSTVTLPQLSISCFDFVVTLGSVKIDGIISTNGIIGAGLKKCIPITRSAFLHAEAIDAIDKEDVLVAKIQSSETIRSKSENNFCFTSMFSTIASIINPQSLN